MCLISDGLTVDALYAFAESDSDMERDMDLDLDLDLSDSISELEIEFILDFLNDILEIYTMLIKIIS
jgi:hypothetical protein